MTHSIEARDLTIRYGETTAVDGLSFRLDGGKIHGLLGRNGPARPPCCRSWRRSAAPRPVK